MITYLELKNAVVGYLRIENTAADVTRFDIDNKLNDAQTHILATISHKYIRNALKTVKGALANGVVAYQWPSDFLRIKSLWLDYGAQISITNYGRPARYQEDITDRSSQNRIPTTEYPLYSANVEEGFEIAPAPAADQANGFRLRYIQTLLTISSSQDCMLPPNLKNLMTFYSTHLCALIDGYNKELSATMLDDFKDEQGKFLPKIES